MELDIGTRRSGGNYEEVFDFVRDSAGFEGNKV